MRVRARAPPTRPVAPVTNTVMTHSDCSRGDEVLIVLERDLAIVFYEGQGTSSHDVDRPMQDRREALKDWRDDARPASVPGTALIGKAFNLLDTIGAAPGLVTVSELVWSTG